MPWIKLTATLPSGLADELETALDASGAVAVTLEDAGDEPVLEPLPGDTPLWSETRLSALFPAGTDPDHVTTALGPTFDALRWRTEVLEDRAWERAWMDDFHPMRFGRRLWICPGGMECPAPDGVIVNLDPGLAFGTGTHPTTALCLEWLDGHMPVAGPVVDYGCGSGVLAVAAARLGATRVLATDIDPQALQATRDNARRNAVEEAVATCEPGQLDDVGAGVLLANILAGPLCDLAARFAELVRFEGYIVLSGILEQQIDQVMLSYRPWFRLDAPVPRDGWVRITGQRTRDD